jgi:hypothetical protein
MAEYVLIWVFIAYGRAVNGSAEFNAKQACEDAKYKLEKTAIESNKFEFVTVQCHKTNN